MNEMAGDSQGYKPIIQTTATPELRPEQIASGQANTPGTPGAQAPFDWDEFETRYSQALEKADRQEQELMREFETLVKYFNNWAASSSAHDTERAIKRLQTRQRFVNISEETMDKRQQHLDGVLQAFQNALALLQKP